MAVRVTIEFDVEDKVLTPVWMFGGPGNNDFHGGGGNDVMVGGSGNNHLVAGTGRDILIGGPGQAKLEGQGGEDILIAGTTDYDANEAALRRSWPSGPGPTRRRPSAQRVSNLKNGVGPNGVQADRGLRPQRRGRRRRQRGRRARLGLRRP